MVRPAPHPLDAALRRKRRHAWWMTSQACLGILPVFGLLNRFHPMVTDGSGGDLLPALLPDFLAGHYHLLLASGLSALALSELLRRRYHARYRDELEL